MRSAWRGSGAASSSMWRFPTRRTITTFPSVTPAFQLIGLTGGYELFPLALYVREYHREKPVLFDFAFNTRHLSRAARSRISRDVSVCCSTAISPRTRRASMRCRCCRPTSAGRSPLDGTRPRRRCRRRPCRRCSRRRRRAIRRRWRWCATARHLGYGELDSSSNQLARRLIGLGIGPETVVGLALERSVELVVAVLAVLKAGGCYLPLDAGHPPARLAFLLADAGAALVLTTAALEKHLPPEVPALRLDDDAPALSSAPLGDDERRGDARPRPSRLHHLHLGIHRRPQGRRRQPSRHRQSHAVAQPPLRARPRRPRAAEDRARLRRLGLGVPLDADRRRDAGHGPARRRPRSRLSRPRPGRARHHRAAARPLAAAAAARPARARPGAPPAPGLLRRRGLAGGADRALPRAARRRAAQSLRSHRGDDRRDELALRGRRRGPDGAAGPADREHAGLHPGRPSGAGAGGGCGGALSRRRRSGAGLCRAAGADGGAVRGGPVRRRRRAALPDGGSRALAGRRGGGVPRPLGRPGEAAGPAHRARRDRGGAAGARRGGAGGGGGVARAPGGLCGGARGAGGGGGAALPSRGAPAGAHAAAGLCLARRAAAHAERQARPARAARAGVARGRRLPGAAGRGGGAAGGAVGRAARHRPHRPPRQFLHLGRRQHSQHSARGAGAGRRSRADAAADLSAADTRQAGRDRRAAADERGPADQLRPAGAADTGATLVLRATGAVAPFQPGDPAAGAAAARHRAA